MEIVSRHQWGATADLGSPMTLPAAEVWLHHSVTIPTDDPAADMRGLERIGVQRFGRFSYSYAVHPDGTALEGAGTTIGAHTAGRNSTSFGIVLIGNYEQRDPTDRQMNAVAGLIRWLVDTRKLRPGTYPTGGHRDLKSTACPGACAYRQIEHLRQLTANPEVDDMTPDECRQVIREELHNTDTGLRAEVGRAMSWLTTGRGNKAFNPTVEGGRWIADAVTLPKVLVAVGDLDEVAVAAQVLAVLSPEAIAAALNLPADIARQVVDELHHRTAPTEGEG